MQAPTHNESSIALSDDETPASRPGLKTVLALGGAAVAIAALVYAQELKAFFHLT